MNVGEVLKSIVGYDEHIGGLSDALKTLDPSIASAPATFVTHDHRRVSDGAIFVAFSGTAIDSHQYISKREVQERHASLERHQAQKISILRSRIRAHYLDLYQAC